MRFFGIVAFLFLLFILGCVKTTADVVIDYKPVTDLSQYKMKVIPEPQTSADNVRLVVYDDCQYNNLAGVTRNGNTIEIEKRFNSMMKLPCMLRNDTIPIGKLAVGSYKVNYKLVDVSTIVKDPIVLAISFNMLVVK